MSSQLDGKNTLPASSKCHRHSRPSLRRTTTPPPPRPRAAQKPSLWCNTLLDSLPTSTRTETWGPTPSTPFKNFADLMAKIYHPVMAKAATHAREPVAWRVGHLVAIYKSKGDTIHCKCNRGIFVEDVAAKAYHRWIRRRAEPALHDNAAPG